MTEQKLHRISDHVYWMKPDVPDRPSLCAVVGKNLTVMLDGAASKAHARLFLDALTAEKVRLPDYVVLTHWHWDHVFGLAEIGRPVMAQRETAARLETLSHYDWQDSALDERVLTGEEAVFCADNIKLELPAPRDVQIRQADIVFDTTLQLRLGDVTCQIEHVGGDHAADSSVIYVMPDKLLFLGDCLYYAMYAPVHHHTTRNMFPLLDKLLAYDAEFYVEGHSDMLINRDQFEGLARKLRLIGTTLDEIGSDEAAVQAAVTARTGLPLDEVTKDLIASFIAGL
jgi:glyoxylase-like metal-dependent hydrolase (beta-lactamase superfamily II)